MFTVDTQTKLHYTFNDAVQVIGTLGQIDDIATKLGLEVDYTKLMESNGLKNEYYESTTLGLVKVTDMQIDHLRHALLKQLRNFFTKESFKDVSNEEFLKRIVDPDFYDSDIKMLYEELSNRLD